MPAGLKERRQTPRQAVAPLPQSSDQLFPIPAELGENCAIAPAEAEALSRVYSFPQNLQNFPRKTLWELEYALNLSLH